MPGEGGAAGRGGGAIEGAAGLAAIGTAGAAGLGAATGFAAAGLRGAALRAAGLRAAFLVVLRAEVFRAAALRAVARLRAGVFFALFFLVVVLRALVFLAPARRALALLVLRFFPLFLVAMASAPICSIVAPIYCRTDRLNGRVRCTNHASLVQACRPTNGVNRFFQLYDDHERKWQFGASSRARILTWPFMRRERCTAPPRMGIVRTRPGLRTQAK